MSFRAGPKNVIKNQIPRLKLLSKEKLRDVTKIFEHITNFTVPYGYEDWHYKPMLTNMGFEQDNLGNFYLRINDKDDKLSSTCFMAHLDTASSKAGPIVKEKVGSFIQTDGETILGADDRAGVSILLYLIAKKMPGMYCLFVGEESGCQGSKHSAAEFPTLYTHIERAICFDRVGYNSIITHQVGTRTCSEQFAYALSESLSEQNMFFEADSGGVYTDSCEFKKIIPECTNLSVGYRNAHCCDELQNIRFLKCLAEAAAKIAWDELPTYRDPSIEENKWPKYYQVGKTTPGQLTAYTVDAVDDNDKYASWCADRFNYPYDDGTGLYSGKSYDKLSTDFSDRKKEAEDLGLPNYDNSVFLGMTDTEWDEYVSQTGYFKPKQPKLFSDEEDFE